MEMFMYRMFKIQPIRKKYESRLDLHRYQLVGLWWIVVGGFLHACAGTNDEHADPYMQTLPVERAEKSPIVIKRKKIGTSKTSEATLEHEVISRLSGSGRSEMSLLK
jgi:hypothetical protein